MSNLRKEASDAYYRGEPIMSDAEYDALPELEEIGHEPTGNKSKHPYQMWSLQKIYEETPPFTGGVETPKLDGAAIRLSYDRKLIEAATRGNGKIGENISSLMQCAAANGLIPFAISCKSSIQIVGEMVAPSHIKNSRNYAAGALNLKSVDEFATRDLTFVAYGVYPYQSDSWSADMRLLSEWGFNTVLDNDWSQFPQDGRVFRIDNYAEYEACGYTAKFPRGAYAKKTQQVGSITTLLDVEWQVGRSGVVAPVAILEPVLVGDATVSRATLHNIKYIEALGLDYGCKVEVIRSGEIIPRIIRRVDE